MTQLTYKKFKSTFFRFLKEKGVYCIFIYDFKNFHTEYAGRNESINDYLKKCAEYNYNPIMDAFAWAKSDYVYWSEIHNAFSAILRKKTSW